MGNSTKKDNAFIYADKEQQLIRANRFMALASTIYYLYMIALVAVSVAARLRSIGFAGLIIVMVLITLAVTWIIFKRNPKSTRMRYLLLIGLCMIGWTIAYAYSQDFATIIGAFVIICGVLYFEVKYIIISGIAYSVATLFAIIAKNVSGENALPFCDCV